MSNKKTYSQAARVQGILRTLGARHSITIGELAEGFGVTRRTLYRDLKALEEASHLLLSMTASGKEEIKAWVLSFGPKAEVLSPKLLSQAIKEDISRALVFYRS